VVFNVKLIVLYSEDGEITKKEVVEGELQNELRKRIVEVLKEWKPLRSDLIVMKEKHRVTLSLPLSKELYDTLSKFGLRKVSSNEVEAAVPVFVISYDNVWIGENVRDMRVIVVAPFVNEDFTKEVEELAKGVTSFEAEQ